MRTIVSILILTFCSIGIFGQDKVQVEKEILNQFKVGDGENEVSYHSDEEGFYSPKGPMIGKNGDLYFLPNTTNDSIQIVYENKLTDLAVPSSLRLSEILNRRFFSSNGLVLNGSGFQFIAGDRTIFYYNYYHKIHEYLNLDYAYPAPFGAILYSDKQKQGIAVVFDVKNPKKDFNVIGQIQFPSWLPTQPGGFSIGSDGRLYRNGYLWSVSRDYGEYVGRLMSGHAIHVAGGISGFPREFGFVNSRYELEMMITIPWAYDERENKKGFHWFNYGVGPWGEIYFLIAPPQVSTNQFEGDGAGGRRMILKFDETKPAELVVVRNHLKYFGRLNDGGVRLRKEPNTTGEILGTYPNKTGFRILEKGTKEETIGGKKNVWYKVRLLDGKEGWFFGSFVHNLYDGPNGTPPPWPNVPDW